MAEYWASLVKRFERAGARGTGVRLSAVDADAVRTLLELGNASEYAQALDRDEDREEETP